MLKKGDTMQHNRIMKSVALLLCIIMLSSCKKETPVDPPTPGPDLTELRGAYLG